MGNDRSQAKVFTVPVHRNFADALVHGLLASFGHERMVLARGIVIVPNNRAATAINDAFVRRAEAGLLLPRIVPVGDVGGDDMPGVMFDSANEEPVPPAIDPLRRRLMLARLVQQERAAARAPVDAAEAMRLASDLAATIDALTAERVPASRLRDVRVARDLSVHWQASLDLFAVLLDRWPEALATTRCIDLAERRNRLIERAARRWREAPPAGFVVAAGVTSSAPVIAQLLKTIARIERGMVVLPGIDLASPAAEWEAIGGSEAQPPIENHPQFHLRLLLDRMGVARSDVVRWRWGDGQTRQAVRARAVSNAFAPARFTVKWNELPGPQRRLPGVRLAEFANAADEAQGIAIALREAIETPLRTAALVTPDRDLAQRVVQHLRRWGIEADDSAGRPLAATPPGTLIASVAELAVERFAPVPLLSALKHPLVMAGEARLDWLDGVRRIDRALRGPRPAPGIAGLRARLAADAGAAEAWAAAEPLLAPLEGVFEGRATLTALIEAVRGAVERLAGDAAWSGPAGRAAGTLFDDVLLHAGDGPLDIDADALPGLLRTLMGEIAVRPPQGGHHRIAIRGLLEARLQAADLLILGGLNEGGWPTEPAPDPWLAPKIRQELGLGGLERRIGLAAHDLASALGGREVLMTRARRDARSPTIASRFLLRLEAMLGGVERDARIEALGRAIDASDAPPMLSARPAPRPAVALRPREISVTSVDRLKADPFAFYAQAMLKLRALDAVDADPGPAWRGSAVHEIFDKWFRDDALDPARLHVRVATLLDDPATHPLVRALWQPRLVEAIDWIAAQVASDRAKGRVVIASEAEGRTEIAGVVLRGRADRIDDENGVLAIVDYKTGTAPSAKAVAAGYSMQLGLLGLIAERGGFPAIRGVPRKFEYWSLAKKGNVFGNRSSPVEVKGSALTADGLVAESAAMFADAAGRWLTGNEAFTAKLNPEMAPYEDYDQLMRLGEWYGREER